MPRTTQQKTLALPGVLYRRLLGFKLQQSMATMVKASSEALCLVFTVQQCPGPQVHPVSGTLCGAVLTGYTSCYPGFPFLFRQGLM